MSLALATKGLLHSKRLPAAIGGRIQVEQLMKPKIEVNSIKYINGKDEKTQTITIKEVIISDITE